MSTAELVSIDLEAGTAIRLELDKAAEGERRCSLVGGRDLQTAAARSSSGPLIAARSEELASPGCCL